MIIKSIKAPQRLNVKLLSIITMYSLLFLTKSYKKMNVFPVKKSKLHVAGIKVEDKVQNKQDE
jgi:hypothetical protein